MEDVIAPISKELLKAELTEEKRLRMTNRSHNQIYIITAQDSPNTMKEIGRLREIAFRAAVGFTYARITWRRAAKKEKSGDEPRNLPRTVKPRESMKP